MSRRYYLIKGNGYAAHDYRSGKDKDLPISDLNLPKEHEANKLMNAEGFEKYVQKHGYHFTESLAEHLSKKMSNHNGMMHSWTPAQVKKAFESLGMPLPPNTTWGDLIYESNKAYAVLYPDILKEEVMCLKYAHRIANHHSDHDGVVFSRWLSDAINKEEHIDWEEFV